MHTMSHVRSKIADHGFENASIRYEVIKRDGMFLVELVKHWVSRTIKYDYSKISPVDGEYGAPYTINHNNRLVLATIYPTMDQNKPNASPPRDIAGAVAWTKHMSTLTGIPMSVNLPN